MRKPATELRAGMEIAVDVPPPPPSALEAQDIPLRVLYEDADLLVIDKPAGMVVHPAPGARRDTLVNALLHRARHIAGVGATERPGIVHRLDRDTSGLLVVARSDAVYARLQEAIRAREVERRYLALVRGTPRSRTGRIDAPIGRDRRDPIRRSLDTEEPRDAVTWFEVVERMGGIEILDGRHDGLMG